MPSGSFLYIKLSILCIFYKKRDIHTDEPTDIPSYRDARTHLKNKTKQNKRKLGEKKRKTKRRKNENKKRLRASVGRLLGRYVMPLLLSFKNLLNLSNRATLVSFHYFKNS